MRKSLIIKVPIKKRGYMAYFLVLVSNKNLKHCRKFGLAGFPEGDESLWPYFDIREGDYVSFYRSGMIYDYYKVTEKHIAANPEDDNPNWEPIGKDRRFFPYRLVLAPIVQSEDPYQIFREELIPFGQSLLPRFAFGKSHIQLPSSIGEKVKSELESFNKPYTKFVANNKFQRPKLGEPKLFTTAKLTEKLIQVLVKRNISDFLPFDETEILSETHWILGK